MEYLCNICKKKILESERTTHEMICGNSIRPEEYADLIPCEICNNLVNADDYINHTNECYRNSMPINNFFDFFRNHANIEIPIPQVDNNNNIIEITDDSINDIFNLLTNIQPNNNINNYDELTSLSEEIGNVEVGISNIDNILKRIDGIFKCPICYSDKDFCMETECKHKLCLECSKTWFVSNKKCPICNKELE